MATIGYSYGNEWHRQLPHMSDGFSELWRRKRLNLTVKALILEAACTRSSRTRSAKSPVSGCVSAALSFDC